MNEIYAMDEKKNVESCVNKFVLLFASIVFVKVQPYIEV